MTPSATTLVLNAIREGLVLVLLLSAPPLIASMVTGFIVGLFQAATQIQDQTLNQVPKMFTVAAAVFVLLPWILGVLVEYTHDLVKDMGVWLR